MTLVLKLLIVGIFNFFILLTIDKLYLEPRNFKLFKLTYILSITISLLLYWCLNN